MSKPIKYVVAFILKKNPTSNDFLVVKRPDDDPDLAGSWGFPATTMTPGELPEAAAKRVCGIVSPLRTPRRHIASSIGVNGQ